MKKFLVIWSTLKVKAYLGLWKCHEVRMTAEFSAELAMYTVQLHGAGEQFQNSNLDVSTELNLRSLYHSFHGYSIVWSYLDLPTCCVCLGISLKHPSPEPLQVKTRRYTCMHMHGCMHVCTHTHILGDTHVSWSSFAWWDVKIQLSWMASHPKGPLVKLGFQGTPGIVKPTLSLTGRLSKSFLFCSENVFVFFLKNCQNLNQAPFSW